MNSLKEKIAEKLENLNESELQEVFTFVNIMTGKKTTATQLLLSPKETEEDCQIKYVGGVLVVAGSGKGNWENVVEDLREERIGKFIC